MFELSFWPVLAAGIANVVLGMTWYNPKVFGAAWMRMANITPEAAERGKKRMPVAVVVALLASMLTAYVMYHFGVAWGVYDWIGAVELASWIWIGFVAPLMLGIVLWEGKPLKLYFINVGYWLVALIVMAVILFW